MKNVFMFPGQGSQYIGMGETLYKNFKIGKLIFEEACDTLGFNLKKLCFEGNSEELMQTQNTQPAILTVSYAALQILLNETGLKPNYCLGHSLGEYTALVCSEAVQFKDALKIVRERGEIMNRSLSGNIGTMAAIEGLTLNSVIELCNSISSENNIVEVSCINSSKQLVVSGHYDAIKKLETQVIKKGAKYTPLKVSAPFHCSLMSKAADKLKKELLKHQLMIPKTPVISNVTALAYKSTDEIITNLTLQMTSPIRWNDSILYIIKKGAEKFYEIGPKKVLSGLFNGCYDDLNISSFGMYDELSQFKNELISNPKYNIIEMCLSEAICVKNLNFNNTEYYNGVINPYNEIKQMQNHLLVENLQPSEEHIMKTIDMFFKIMETKKVPISEQKIRFNKLISMFPEADCNVEKYSSLLNT